MKKKEIPKEEVVPDKKIKSKAGRLRIKRRKE